jgi:hypothetical protein
LAQIPPLSISGFFSVDHARTQETIQHIITTTVPTIAFFKPFSKLRNPGDKSIDRREDTAVARKIEGVQPEARQAGREGSGSLLLRTAVLSNMEESEKRS